MWTYRNVEQSNINLLSELLQCENHNARAAAARQLRHWHSLSKEGDDLLTKAALDENGLVRLEAAIACSYIGTKNAFETLKIISTQPNEKHLSYAIKTSFGSAPMRKFWDPRDSKVKEPIVYNFLSAQKKQEVKIEKSRSDNKFDRQKNLLKVKVSCLKERMLFSVKLMMKPNLGEYKISSTGDILAKKINPFELNFPIQTPLHTILFWFNQIHLKKWDLQRMKWPKILMPLEMASLFLNPKKLLLIRRCSSKEKLRFYALRHLENQGFIPTFAVFPDTGQS